jgi:hypothetical protein
MLQGQSRAPDTLLDRASGKNRFTLPGYPMPQWRPAPRSQWRSRVEIRSFIGRSNAFERSSRHARSPPSEKLGNNSLNPTWIRSRGTSRKPPHAHTSLTSPHIHHDKIAAFRSRPVTHVRSTPAGRAVHRQLTPGCMAGVSHVLAAPILRGVSTMSPDKSVNHVAGPYPMPSSNRLQRTVRCPARR